MKGRVGTKTQPVIPHHRLNEGGLLHLSNLRSSHEGTRGGETCLIPLVSEEAKKKNEKTFRTWPIHGGRKGKKRDSRKQALARFNTRER